MGNTFGTTPATTANTAPNYCTLSIIAELLAELPSSALPTLRAAGNADRIAATAQATSQIDQLRFQGRKYDLLTPQVLQFPRVPNETPRQMASWGYAGAPGPVGQLGLATQVWDWDSTTSEAVVPRDVKLACLHQADSILAADREARLDAQRDGLIQQSVGGLSEQYAAGGKAATPELALCRQAVLLLEKYRIKGGHLL